jgi:tetratricopeptide (TPR) repeat protein
MKPSVKIRVWLWLIVTVVCLLACSAEAAKKPKRREVAPDVRAAALERRLAEPELSASARAYLSVELAESLYKLNDFEREAEVLQDALAAGITDTNLAAQAHYYLGRTLQSLGSNDQAADHFEIVWQQYPGSHFYLHAAMELGDLMLQAGDTEAATQWYQAIIDLKPRAKLAFLARDKLRAIADGLPAEQITDESQRPVYVKHELRELDQYLYSQQYSNADTLAQELIASRTNAALRAAMNYHVAHRYWLYGHVEGADRFMAEALNTRGDRHTSALILAGHVKRALGQEPAALSYYRQAMTIAPTNAMTITAYQQSVRLLLRAGAETNALALAEQGRQVFAGNDKLPAYLDRIANTLRDRAHPQWREYATQVAVTATNELGRRALMQLANEARLQRDLPRAEQFYQQLVQRPSASWRSTVDMQVRLLDTQLEQSNVVAAAATEQSLLNSMPTMPTEGAKAYIRYRLGKVWLQHEDGQRAEARWQQILSQHPDTGIAKRAQIQLARLYESRGQIADAIALYEAFVQRPSRMRTFKLHAYARLVALREQLGQTALAAQDAAAAETLANETDDAELQLNLAQHYLRHGDSVKARQLLERGLQNADARLRKFSDPATRLRWEYLIGSRLDEFKEYERLAARLPAVETELLQNPALDENRRYLCYFMFGRALEKCGRSADSEALCQRAIQSIPEDSHTVGQIYYRLSQQAKARGEPLTVRELAEAAFEQTPRNHFSQVMYLDSAAEDFNAGQPEAAMAKVSALEKAVPVGMEKGWPEHFRWDCQYLKGRCLTACGEPTEGQRLVNQSLAHKPDMPVALKLRQSTNPGH